MHKLSFRPKNRTWARRPLAVLLVATAIPVTAFGADRMVLCEEFTATS